MKKSKFIKSSIILIIGGMLTKALGMLVKIILSRCVTTHVLGLYSLIIPTFLLLITISGLGLTTSLNVLISSKKYNNKNLIITSLIISLSIDFLIIIFLCFTHRWIATLLFKSELLSYPILSMGFILPFISISNIFRSYYFSKERLIPHVVSNILEDLVKVILILLFINKISNNIPLTLTFIIGINIFSELSSILIFLYKAPKFTIYIEDLKPNIKNIKALLSISIPTTISRLIGSITYFLEPIILTGILLHIGYSNDYIVNEYGIINAYVLPILLLPSFFTNAISQALIPSISLYYTKRDFKNLKKRINQATIISLILGIIFTIFIICFGSILLKILYKTNSGIKYIRLLAPIFLFHYIEHPLLASIQAMNKAKINMKISLVNMFIRTILLALLCFLKIGIYPLLIALSLNILFSCFYSAHIVNKIIRLENK